MSASAPPPPATTERAPRAGRLVLGGVLLVLGALWLLDTLGVEIPGHVVGPSALIVVGVGLVAAARWGRSQAGLIVLGVILTVVLAVGTVVSVPLTGEVGDRIYRPRTIDDVRASYALSVGNLTVDLSGIPVGPTPERARVGVRVGLGQVVVIMPAGSDVAVHAKAGIGQTVVFGVEEGGFGVDYQSPSHMGGLNIWRLDASTGIGRVEVRYG